ncbi:unnamed protein product [Echinostoma caproni]|uniref:Nucleoporin_N domain-containing protein n=1 Tax=Echinostoma caproni TaxID=27848 RepID=A0A183AGM8_9TREM|nr:unnamed protein product [Echinostoma caproni]
MPRPRHADFVRHDFCLTEISSYTNFTDLLPPPRLSRLFAPFGHRQYLAFLIGGQSVELWKLSDFTLTTRIPFTPEMQVVALVFISVPISVVELLKEAVFSSSHEPNESGSITYLIAVDVFSRIGVSQIPDHVTCPTPPPRSHRTIPDHYNNKIPPRADGFVALRDLHDKKTLVRFNSGGGWGLVSTGSDNQSSSSAECPADMALKALSAATVHTTGVRRLSFLSGPTAYTRLLVLLHDSLFVWQPRDMILICMARFGEQLQRCLISADWAFPISAPSDPVFCLILGADGALRLAQTGESGSEMTILTSTSPMSNMTSNSEQPITKFFGSSAIPDRVDSQSEHERAVNLLLETRPDCPTYNWNMYKACLLAANASGRLRPSTTPSSAKVAEDTYMSTVKLVATNLLSNGQLDEGIELLCLIGLYADACRYLESFDQWDHSIWLAKVTFPLNPYRAM